MKTILAAVGMLCLIAGAARAEAPKVSHLTVYGQDACPKGAADEIVVCAREPESERYRIPKRFRDRPREDAASLSWTSKLVTLEDAARPMRPDSCSAVGSNGQTGCTAAMLRQWFAERRQMRAEAADIP